MRVKISGHTIEYKTSRDWRADALKKNRKNLAVDLELALKNSKFKYFSISHTRHLGGFAIAKKSVGFDLEARDRKMTSKAAAWFASPLERAATRNPLYIWVMKEAAYKATRGPRQPLTVRQIKIVEKKVSRNKTWSFQFEANDKRDRLALRGQGLLKINSRTIMGIALLLT